MPDAPAGDALAAAEHDLDDAVIHLPDHDWTDYARARNALIAAARAEGAAEEREACARLLDRIAEMEEDVNEAWCYRHGAANVRARARARAPSSGTEGRA